MIADIFKTAGIIAITSMSQMTGVIDSTSNGKPAVVDIYSEHCGYSHQMASVLANYVPTTPNIGFYGANANEVLEITGKYEIKGVPTFIGYACGKELSRVIGSDQNGLSDLLTKLANTKC